MDYHIRTDRLDLIAATLDHLNAELSSVASLEASLGVGIPEGWPPGEYDSSAMEFFRDRLMSDSSGLGWYSWYAVLRASDAGPSILIGAGGYLGPPANDGDIEIGYSIVPRFEGQGFATELVRALVDHAFASGTVRRVLAHANPANSSSMRVLEKNGFHMAGGVNEAGLVEWTREMSR